MASKLTKAQTTKEGGDTPPLQTVSYEAIQDMINETMKWLLAETTEQIVGSLEQKFEKFGTELKEEIAGVIQGVVKEVDELKERVQKVEFFKEAAQYQMMELTTKEAKDADQITILQY